MAMDAKQPEPRKPRRNGDSPRTPPTTKQRYHGLLRSLSDRRMRRALSSSSSS